MMVVSELHYRVRMGAMPEVGAVEGPAGLSGAVARGVLRRSVGGQSLPFAPTAFDVELLGAVEAAIAAQIPIALVLPLPGTTAPLLLGAAALIGAVLRGRSLDTQVAVVSSHLTSRTLYDQLCFRNQSLSDFIPRTSIGFDGTVRTIGKPRSDAGGRLHLVNSTSRLSGLSGRLSGIVVDAGATNQDDLRWVLDLPDDSGSLIYLTDDPYDRGLMSVREAGGAIWGWDGLSLDSSPTPPGSIQRPNAGPIVTSVAVLASAATSETIVLAPEAGRTSMLDKTLDDLWSQLARLGAVYRGRVDSGSAFALRWVWGVFNTLSLLPVSPVRYDAHVGFGPYAVRLGDAAAAAYALARATGGQLSQRWSAVAEAIFTTLAAAAKEERLTCLIRWVAVSAAEGRATLLLVRSAAARNALCAALDESDQTPVGWATSVSVATLSELTSGRQSLDDIEEILLPGTLPRRNAGLLALPPVPVLSVLTTGPFESQRALRQATASRAALAAIREETLTQSAPRLSAKAIPRRARAHPNDAIRFIAGAVEVPRTSWIGALKTENPWEPFAPDVLALLRKVASTRSSSGDDVTAPTPGRSVAGTFVGQVPVLAIELVGTDGVWILLTPPNDPLTRRRGNELQKVAAKSVVEGDIIFLVDHAARSDLLAAVIAKLSETPECAALEVLVDFWHSRVRRVTHSGLTYREILHRMHGTSITSEQAIGTWVREDVNGPQDPADVRRFALAVQDRVLLAQAERVGWALKTLQIVHRKAGRWLSSQITGAHLRDDETLIDARLGIHVSDLMESVTAHTVRRVDFAPRTAAAYQVGCLVKSASGE